MMLLRQDDFAELSRHLFGHLGAGQSLTLNLTAERTHFCRLNDSKIRQNGTLVDHQLELALLEEDSGGNIRRVTAVIPLSARPGADRSAALSALNNLRREVERASPDPWAQLPGEGRQSCQVVAGELPEEAALASYLCDFEHVPLTGIYSGGTCVRANATSTGSLHWFGSDSFSLDYSLYGTADNECALKGLHAGRDWDTDAFREEVALAGERLELLRRPRKTLSPGRYPVYLAPAATCDLLSMLKWIFSESAKRRGMSPLHLTALGEQVYSPAFHFSEDFAHGDSPRFTEQGQLAPLSTPLIESGKLASTLIGQRSAKEYNLESTGHLDSEFVQAGVVAAGSVPADAVLERLGQGIYISNLHYLNWSDRPAGRVTGMTRHACFWVENARLSAPIVNLRWDDTLSALLGKKLIGLTDKVHVFPHTGSYSFRWVGAFRCPGLLIEEMNFTL